MSRNQVDIKQDHTPYSGSLEIKDNNIEGIV